MKTLAGVMGDLELVLLQTSLADAPDAAALAQIQRLIHKRDLVTKMDVAATTGSWDHRFRVQSFRGSRD